jgi:hypothetical protein
MLAHSKPGLQFLYLNAANGVIRDFDLVENSVRDSASDLIRYNISDGVLSSDSRPFSVWERDGHFPESVGPSNVTNGLGDSLHLIRQFGFGRSAAAPRLVGQYSCCGSDVPNSGKQFLVLIVFSPFRGRASRHVIRCPSRPTCPFDDSKTSSQHRETASMTSYGLFEACVGTCSARLNPRCRPHVLWRP